MKISQVIGAVSLSTTAAICLAMPAMAAPGSTPVPISGSYNVNPTGPAVPSTWNITPCGAGCINVDVQTSWPATPWAMTAQWQNVSGQWGYAYQNTLNDASCHWHDHGEPRTYTGLITPTADPGTWQVADHGDSPVCPGSGTEYSESFTITKNE